MDQGLVLEKTDAEPKNYNTIMPFPDPSDS